MQITGKKLQGIFVRGALLVLGLALLVAAQQVGSGRKVVKLVSAEYPAVLKSRGIGGSVRMRVLVTPSGTVKDVQVVGGNPILAECAVKAVKQWTFNTAEKEETVDITLAFNPNASN